MLAVTGTMAPFTGMTTYAAEAAEETQSAEASVEDQTSAADAAAATDADQQEESEQEEEIETAAEPVEETEEIEEQAENTGADVVEEVSEDSDEDEDSESGNTEETSEEGGTQQEAAADVEEKIESEEGKETAQGITAIVLNESEINLKTDETFQLTATVNTEEGETAAVQDYTVEWYSDNSRIAQVDDNGLVTAKKHGNTSIHASVEGYDENGDYYQYSAACSVNVTAAMEGTCGDNLTWKIDEEGNLEYDDENLHYLSEETETIVSQLSASPSRYCWKVCPVASVTRSVTNAPSGQLASNDTPRAVGRSGKAKFAAT